MAYTIEEIAGALGLTAMGAVELKIDGLAEPGDATERDLAMAMKPQFAEQLPKGAARAAVLWEDADWQALGLEAAILAPRPRFAMATLTALFDPGQGWEPGIHPSAIIHDSATIGENVSIGPFTVIRAEAEIGAGTVIGPHCHVGHGSRLGPECFLREGVRIGPRVTMGARVICQPGVAIGGDGFSFVTAEPSSVEKVRKSLGEADELPSQSWSRIHSLGGVIIGDDVEIGANSAVDSGTIRATRIGNRTKLDNLVMIGHNVEVGEDCLLCGQVGIAGSSRIGNNVVLAGQVGVSDNLFIGDNVVAGGATTVLANVPAGRAVLGYPAAKMDTTLEIFRNLRRLSRLFGDVAELKKTVSKLGSSD